VSMTTLLSSHAATRRRPLPVSAPATLRSSSCDRRSHWLPGLHSVDSCHPVPPGEGHSLSPAEPLETVEPAPSTLVPADAYPKAVPGLRRALHRAASVPPYLPNSALPLA